MTSFGCQVRQRMAFGKKDGFPYSAELLAGSNKTQLLFRFAVDGGAGPAAKALKKQKLAFTRWFAEPDEAGGALVGLLTLPSEFYARSAIYTLLQAAAGALAAERLAAPEACPLCGLAGCDHYALLDGALRPAHQRCLETRLDLPEADARPRRKVEGNWITGALGALPIWALMLAQGRLYWAMYIFIPLLSGFMYRLCRGKANRVYAGVVVLACSILATMALEQVWFWLELTYNFGVVLSFASTIPAYFAYNTFFGALRKMLMCLVALMIGYVAVTIFLRRYEEGAATITETTRGRAFVLSTAIPMKGEAGNEAGPDELDGEAEPHDEGPGTDEARTE